MLNATKVAPAVLAAVERLSPRVIRILGQNPGPYTLQGTNTYLVGTGTSRILVDTGQGKPEYGRELQAVLEAEKCSKLKVLLTHHHYDHIGGILDVAAMTSMDGVHKWPLPIAAAGLADEGGSNSSANAETLLRDVVPIETDGTVFAVEGATMRTLFTPGHCDDHCGFVLEEEEALFAGDCVLGEGTTVFTNLSLYMRSLHRILDAGIHRIYPGHGPVVEDGPALVRQYVAHRGAREEQIVNVLATSAGPVSVAELVARLYVGYPEGVLAAARKVAGLHLEKLLDDGRVEYDAGLAAWRLRRSAAL
eukprot:c4142_g1_i1.p1 GENE.c4142_g1_i1~~c4142_g1_i1.p1  ORF type:complete len:306 (+),score=49.61 c4142_g1_i1:32-949(+)